MRVSPASTAPLRPPLSHLSNGPAFLNIALFAVAALTTLITAPLLMTAGLIRRGLVAGDVLLNSHLPTVNHRAPLYRCRALLSNRPTVVRAGRAGDRRRGSRA